MYKIVISDLRDESIKRISDGAFIPRESNNRDYQQFVEDIYNNGTSIVEGPTVGVTTAYDLARVSEYPPLQEQLDKIYHNGIDAWKADIKAIKDKYPKTQVGITSIAPIPDWVNTALFDKQKEKYIEAKARLAQYELSAGVKNEDKNGPTDYIIEPLPLWVDDLNGVRNPLVVQDEAERVAAQEVISNTPQAVIDSVSS